MNKTIGIIGGVGPLASCDIFRKIIDLSDVKLDQDHVRVCIDSNTNIPDRTAAILDNGPDPVPEMVKSAVRLQSMGADVLIIPCNTAHYFYDDIVRFVDIPILNMIEETVNEVAGKGYKKVGLLATDGTCRSGIYSDAFSKRGIQTIMPHGENQKAVMNLIYDGIKAGREDADISSFENTLDKLQKEGVEVLILGCTELPVAFELYGLRQNNMDPTAILAKAALKFVGEAIKP